MTHKKPLLFILVKPSGPDCNLACSYCFYTRKEAYFNSDGPHRMNQETLDMLIRKSLNRPGQDMAFGWQGGEPTLMGLDFYQQVITLQKKYGHGMRISNSIQTNGMLIDDSWVSFFKQYAFLVGLSLDGPQHIHDKYRNQRGGGNTHNKVESIAKLMLKSGVEANSLSVITEYSALHAEEIYTYLKKLGFSYMQFIPIMEMSEQNPREVSEYSVTAESYGKFLCDMFDLWSQDFVAGRPTTSIRQFDSYAANYLGQNTSDCTMQKTCGDYFVVEHTGDVYSCDFFVEDTWKLGTIYSEKTLESLLNSRMQTLFGEVKSKLTDKCLRCPWLSFCYGGCPKDRLRNPATKRFNPFCKSIQGFFDYSDNKFRSLLHIPLIHTNIEP